MKSFLFSTALGLLLLTQTAKAQVAVGNFPLLETVYVHLDEQLKKPCKECTIQLAKKPDGYYVEIIPFNDVNYDHVEYLKIWDAATDKYLTVDFGRHLDMSNSDKSSYKGHESIQRKAKESDFNYFFGYPDYTKDLISYLEKKTDLKANELEMLARAYSAEATNFIHPNTSGVIISETKNLPVPDYSKVSADRIKSFQTFAEKSIACYEKIKLSYPRHHPLIINETGLKLNEDLMHYYLTMKLVKEPEIAKSFFDRIQFTPSEIELSKNTLNNCREKGILFTAGDNDTYTLLYVQDKFDWRKDVSIINYSLLQTSWYFDYIQQTCPIKTSLSLDNFKELNEGVIITSKKSTAAPDFSKWLAETNKSLKANKSKEGTDRYPETFATISLLSNNKQLIMTAANGYLGAVDMVILDIMSGNPNSPIYVAHPSVLNEFAVYGKFASRGAIFEFTGTEESNYWDVESTKILNENLKNPNFVYSNTAGSIENWVFGSWCFGLQTVYSSYPSNFKKTYADFKAKLNDAIIIQVNDESMVSQYKSLLETASPEDLKSFLQLYAPLANKRISKIQETKTITSKDVETLAFLQELYSPAIEVSTAEKIPLAPMQKKILKEIQAKVVLIMNNTSNSTSLSWTYEKLLAINSNFERFELN